MQERSGNPSQGLVALVHGRERTAGLAFGRDPTRGTLFGLGAGVAYVGFLLVLRRGGADLRRPAGPLFDATAVAAAVSVAAGRVGPAREAPVPSELAG